LIKAGISPGAALVFLIVGPATNTATIAAVWNLLGRRTAVVYLVSLALCALAAGLTMDAFGVTIPLLHAHAGHTMGGGWFHHAAAVLLLIVLIQSYFTGRKSHNPSPAADTGWPSFRGDPVVPPKKIAFYDTKPYDRDSFDKANAQYGHEIKYFDVHLNRDTTGLAAGHSVVCAFVNDVMDNEVIGALKVSGWN